jgi:type VI secretion system protein ImpM
MQVGFYGKLPSHGDFLRRRISDAFVDAWDAWLRDSLTASRSALGTRWLEVYLTSPAWRFVCAAGACGPSPVLGVVAPSVDQAGRYFPLTLVAELPDHVSLITAAAAGTRFFDAAERLVIETLAAERVDFERFDNGVVGLEQALAPLFSEQALVLGDGASEVLTNGGQAWQLSLGSSTELPVVFEQFLSFQLEEKYRPLVMFWTDGSAVVEPSFLLLKGLPRVDQYPALLDGSWTEHRWKAIPAVPSGDTVTTSAVAEGIPLSFRSAAASDVGRSRDNNEDGFIERPEVGVWAVADGMGGHSNGEVASRMVCDALADFQPDGSFDDAVAAASRRIQAVNDHLFRSAIGSELSEHSGSTVVMLLMRDLRSAVLWAGDSRVYRWRAGRLEQLSRDHSLSELEGPSAPVSSVITRAVGVQPDLALDLRRDAVEPDDRFLLCSDGLTRVLPDSEICTHLQTPDLRAAVDGLIKATLDAGAPDNVTVLIAEAYR